MAPGEGVKGKVAKGDTLCVKLPSPGVVVVVGEV